MATPTIASRPNPGTLRCPPVIETNQAINRQIKKATMTKIEPNIIITTNY